MQDFSSSTEIRAQKEQPAKNRWSAVARGIVSLLIIVYLVMKVNWRELVAQLVRADFVCLTLALILFTVTYMLAAVRWWFLVRVQGIRMPMKVVMALTFIGQFFNSFLLGAVGGDIVKIYYMQKYAPGQKTHATLSIIMDRILGLFILLCASLLVMPWEFRWLMRDGSAHSIIFSLLALFGLGVVTAIVLAIAPFHLAPQRILKIWNMMPHRHILELAMSGFRQHGAALSLTLASLVSGSVMTLVLVAAGYCIAVGIGLSVTFVQMLIILTVVICVISLPISIGGHGVREGIFVLMFSAFGAIGVNRQTGGGQEAAVLFSLLFYAIPLVLSIVGGIVYLTFRHDYGTVAFDSVPD